MRKLKPDFEEVSPLKMIPDDIRIKPSQEFMCGAGVFKLNMYGYFPYI
jgi:hypothetical protein